MEISYSLDTVYDLTPFIYSTDLDKVASAAFNLSSNELLVLVLLLLIAIIVVIAISRVRTDYEYKIFPYRLSSEFVTK